MILAVLSGIQGLAMGISMVAVGAALAEATTPESRGLAMGGYGTAIYTGMAVSSWILGRVIMHRGYRAGFFAAGGVGLAGAVACLLLLAESARNRTVAPVLVEEQEEP